MTGCEALLICAVDGCRLCSTATVVFYQLLLPSAEIEEMTSIDYCKLFSTRKASLGGGVGIRG